MMLLLKVLYGKDDICMNLDELLKAKFASRHI